MGTLTRDCPHCHSANSAFSTFGEYADPEINSSQVYTVALQCGGCHGGYIAKFMLQAGNSPCRFSGDLESHEHLILMTEYPEAIAVVAPGYLPDNVEKFYIQAADSLKKGNHDASAMMSRKVLEVSVKKLNPEGSGILYKRIEQLYAKGKITDDLKDWAHIIRDDGNDATHEEAPVKPEFAEELLSFAELFLMYTFTMPGMVQAKKVTETE